MADQPVTREKLINADIDVDNLGKAVNEEAIVTPRYGTPFKSLPMIAREYDENSGTKGFNTLAEFEAVKSTIPAHSVINIGEAGPNQGQNFWNGTTLTKSAYDPLTQAKDYTNIKTNALDFNKLDKNDAFVQSSNLFNIYKENKGFIISSDGNITVNTNFAYSDFINVDADTNYYFDGFRYVAFYDSNKVFISRVIVPFFGADTPADPYKYYGAIKTPLNCAYIVAIRNFVSLADPLDGIKINKGGISIPFEPFYLTAQEWVKIENINIPEDSVSIDNLDFVHKSANLFNAEACEHGVIIRDTGLIEEFSIYAISDFIPVIPNSKYTISSSDANISPFINIAYYDVDKVFISRSTTPPGTQTLTMPLNAAFVRFNINKNSGLPTEKQRMFNKGDVALPYEEWSLPKLVGVSVDSEINIDEVEQIVEDKISNLPTIDAYIEHSYNLFDHTKATIGKIISATGELLDRPDYAISDFIPVDSGQKYTITSDKGVNAWIYTAHYDANKNFISRVTTANDVTGFLTITTPASARFVRFDINLNTGLPSQRNRMFVKGDKVLPYAPARDEFSIAPTPAVLKTIGSEVKLSRADNIIFDYDIDQAFTTQETLGSYLGFNSSTYQQVHQMYDDLMAAHPNHITKQNLGNDAWGNPIVLYRFKAPQPSTTQATKMPKVFLVTGVHGMEHVSTLTAYLMFDQMMNNWKSSKLLEVLRNNVEFLIIPVVNPTGYNKFTRKNDNGVDLNRNWPYNFGWQSTDPASPYYGGAAPLDQLESQYIVRVFDENPDIDIMYDFHTFNGAAENPPQHLIWTAAYDGIPYVEHITQKLARRMTNHWRDKFEWIPESETWFVGYSDTTIKGASVMHYAAFERNIPFTSIFEVGGKWWIDPTGVPYDLNHKQSCLEALVNFMLINLSELKRI